MKIRDPLIVYNPTERAFLTNGIRIIHPSVATHERSYNEAGVLYIEHPLDADGDWKALMVNYIILAPVEYRGEIRPQPFRIYRVQKQRQGGNTVVVVDAMHVFYDLNYVVVRSHAFSGVTFKSIVESGLNSLVARKASEPLAIDFITGSSNITDEVDFDLSYCSYANALVGSSGLIAQHDAGLFVDKFRFSLNSTMEGRLVNAFNIANGLNLVDMTETIDISNTYSHFFAETSLLGGSELSYGTDYSEYGFPFARTKAATFSFKGNSWREYLKFKATADSYMRQLASYDVSYTVTLAEDERDEELKNLGTLEVGDTGHVYDDDFGISTEQMIVQKKVDLLTGRVLSISLGSLARKLSSPQRFENTISSGSAIYDIQNAAVQEEINDIRFDEVVTTPIATADGKYLTTSGGKYLLYRKE